MTDKSGAESAIKRLYENYADDVYRFARLTLGDSVEAQDVVQEVFVRAFSNWAGFRREASERTWLMAIARNYLFDILRKRKERPASVSVNTISATSDADERTEFTLVLQAALNRLRPDYRQVFVLRHVEEWSVADTARVLGWSPGKVRITDFRAMAKLRADLTHSWKGETDCGLQAGHS